jgi:hypothetical protein
VDKEETDQRAPSPKTVREDEPSKPSDGGVNNEAVEETVDVGQGFVVQVLSDSNHHRAADGKETCTAPAEKRTASHSAPASSAALLSRICSKTNNTERRQTKMISEGEAILASCENLRHQNNARLTARQRAPSDMDEFHWKTVDTAEKQRPTPSSLLRLTNLPPLPGTSGTFDYFSSTFLHPTQF